MIYLRVNRFTPNQQERIRYVLMHSPLVPGPQVRKNNYSYAIRGTGTSDENDKIAFIIEKEVEPLSASPLFLL
ncbi:hypothetical protein NXW09_28870 [Bacteroides ovatus]|nr:hypothetical protein [Bacteroides ovatus]